ncbi:MAG: SoxR reducing system RseC family protein [Lachnospirales bacterium]
MSEIGEIIKINKEEAVVKLRRVEACAKCKACLAGMEGKDMLLTATNSCKGSIGDKVIIELEPKPMLKATFILYGIPLITMVLGFLVASVITSNEIIIFLTGVLVLIITYLFIKLTDKKRDKKEYIPTIKKI